MPSPTHVIVIGTSAGGMSALIRLVGQLPAALPAAVLVVQHLAPESYGELLVERLGRHTGLTCRLAANGTPIETGYLYLAPPDRHLLLKNGHLLVTKGPHENSYRPAADALFRSAAVEYDSFAVGVVLTGMLHDGTAGLDFIKRCGGTAVVQDPADAEYASMPESALRSVEVDYVASIDEMGALLTRLVSTPHSSQPPAMDAIPPDLKQEAAIAERVVGSMAEIEAIGHQVPLTCPDCGGSLWQLNEGQVLRFRCHTGHAFTAEALADSSQKQLEESLWVALRMLEERKALLANMAAHGNATWGIHQNERVEEMRRHINRLREFLLASGEPGSAPASATAA